MFKMFNEDAVGGTTGDAPAGVTATAVEPPVVAKLKALGVAAEVIDKITSTLGVETEEDLRLLKEGDLTAAGMKVVHARRLLESFVPTATAVPVAAPVNGTAMNMSILPQIPDNVNLLASLKVGGVLKVGETEVISAVKAGLYAATRLSDVPRLLTVKMKEFARAQKQQVPAEYRKLKTTIARRSYGPLLAAVQGAESVTTVPKEDKDYLLEQVLGTVFPALASYQGRLTQFVTEYRQTGLDPMFLMQAFAGGPQNALLGVQMPDMGVLHTAAETVIEAINGAFAGDGCIAARALAYDAIEVVQMLDQPNLPMTIGAANREHMLRELKIDVTSDLERLELSIPQYALAIMKFNSMVPGTQDELRYAGAMNQLGTQIPWDLLTNKKVSRTRPRGIGGGVREDEEDEDE